MASCTQLAVLLSCLVHAASSLPLESGGPATRRSLVAIVAEDEPLKDVSFHIKRGVTTTPPGTLALKLSEGGDGEIPIDEGDLKLADLGRRARRILDDALLAAPPNASAAGTNPAEGPTPQIPDALLAAPPNASAAGTNPAQAPTPQIPRKPSAPNRAILQSAALDQERLAFLRLTYPNTFNALQAPWDFDTSGLAEPRACSTCEVPTAFTDPTRHDGEVTVGTEPQLFLDDHLIAEWKGLLRTQTPPRLRYVMSQEEAYMSLKPGVGYEGEMTLKGKGDGWLRMEGRAMWTVQMPPTFPAYVEVSPSGNETILHMGESAMRWSIPSGPPHGPGDQPAAAAAAAATPGSEAAYDQYAPRPPVTGLSLGEALPAGTSPDVVKRYQKSGLGWRPRISKLNDCGEDGPRVVHPHAYYEAHYCPHKDANSHNWKFPDSLCLSYSDDGRKWTAQHEGEPVDKLGHGADSDQSISYSCAAKKYMLVKRRNIPSPRSWRHIRGVEVFHSANLSDPNAWERVHSFWLDRNNGKEKPNRGGNESESDGLDEAYRRQMYGVTTTHFASNLELGITPVLEYPKLQDLGSEKYLKRGKDDLDPGADSMRIYLTSTRDGKTFDLDWVYGGLEMVPLTMLRDAAKAAGRTFDDAYRFAHPARNIVTHNGWHHLYIEARHSHHETRFTQPFELFVASWPMGRLVALAPDASPPDPSPPDASPDASLDAEADGKAAAQEGSLSTRPFKLEGDAVWVNIDLWRGSTCRVELLHVTTSGDVVVDSQMLNGVSDDDGSAGDDAREQGSARQTVGEWSVPFHAAKLSGLRSQKVRLRFTLTGPSASTRLYGFRVSRQPVARHASGPWFLLSEAERFLLSEAEEGVIAQAVRSKAGAEAARRYAAVGMSPATWQKHIAAVYGVAADDAESVARLPRIDEVTLIPPRPKSTGGDEQEEDAKGAASLAAQTAAQLAAQKSPRAACDAISVGGPLLAVTTPHVPQAMWFPPRGPFAGFAPLANHSLAEGTHCAGSAFEEQAAWFYVARGSGLFVDIGRTLAFDSHEAAARHFLGRGCETPECDAEMRSHLPRAAHAAGFDSVQFLHHCDMDCGSCGHELMLTGVKGTGACARGITYGGGIDGKRPCRCVESAEMRSQRGACAVCA